jgi:hypothetical protein
MRLQNKLDTNNFIMRASLAILFTICLLAACYVVSALVYFDLTWILIWITSLWVAIDSAKIELNRYKFGSTACRPVMLFCLCALLWIFIFPWYLWARYKIKSGTAVLKDESISGLEQRPGRRFFRKLSRISQRVAEWVLIGLVGLKIIFLLFCLEECWRGQRVWENYRHELEAKGESFDWDAMIPPLVLDSQNVFSASMMSEWFIKPSGKIIIAEDLSKRLNYSNTAPEVVIAEVTVGAHPDSAKADVSLLFNDFKSHQQAKQLIQNIAGPSAFGARGNDTLTAQPFNLNQIKPLHIFLEADNKPNVKDLIAFFSGHSSTTVPLIFRPTGTNSWQVLTSFCAASDYLKWSDQFRGDFDLMREAVKRPYARMDGDYHYPPTIPIPNFVNIRAVSQTLAQRAQSYLLLGQPDKALRELTLVHDLCHLLEGAPTGKPMTLVASMINVAVAGLYTDTIADGFRLHAWQEPQLVMLQNQLEQIGLAPFVKESFHDEQVSAWRIMQTQIMSQFVIQRIPNATLWQKIKNLRPPNILKGLFYLNVVTVVQMDQKVIDSIDPVQKIVLPEKIAEHQREVDALDHHVLPYKFLAAIFVPNGTRAVQTLAFNQTKADEAQIVCAMERCRLAHGKYPEALDELMPQFIEKLPHDIIGGQPLKYRRTTDGQFTLYSVGWNETDDGGQYYSSSYDKGDWIWQ